MQGKPKSVHPIIEHGCIIDGSHDKTSTFDARVIAFAVALGAEPEPHEMNAIVHYGLSEHDGDEGQILTEAADAAIDWLNEHIADDDEIFVVNEQELHYAITAQQPYTED